MPRAMLVRGALTVAVLAIAVTGLLVLATQRARAPDPPAGPGGTSAAGAPGAALAPEGERATVISVVDAVTFDARLPGREVVRVRALGIQPPGECYADQGVAFAQRILNIAAIKLMPDPGGPPADRFDRRLAHVVLGESDYAVLATEAGIARTYTAGTSESTMPPIRAAEQRARDAGRGVWGPPCTTGSS